MFIQSFDQVVWRDYYVNFSVLMARQLQNSNGPELLDLLELLLDSILLLRDLDLCGISAFRGVAVVSRCCWDSSLSEKAMGGLWSFNEPVRTASRLDGGRGPDAVRTASKIEIKLPATSSDGHESFE